ncbi:MAG: RpiB/LacA/LacB family sugar-phosphate isomerase [Holosporales bacterium]|nr:RpiB/LacA/LacB family sugar-phosphate isomerase [Holosporales bacterium]
MIFEHLAIAADHRGFWLKKDLAEHFDSIGYRVEDLGVDHDSSAVDYPDYANKVAESVLRYDKCFGILVCHTGVGMNIAANRHKGIRSVWYGHEEILRLSRKHNNANVICFGAGFIGRELAIHAADIFTTTDFTDTRHLTRINKLDKGVM